MTAPRPLDRVRSIKLKLGIAIVIAVAVSALVSTIGFRLGVPIWVRPLIAAAIALLLVQLLARGMTSPLREMADAARRMADGDWDQRVTDSSADEVGDLARAFNDMAAELAAVDRMRRDLVANVSHELRTPIAALQARLENLVDGVDQPTTDLLSAMLDQTARLGRLVEQLLDLSRLESGAVPLVLEQVEARAMLEAVADEARLHDPDVDVEVRCDEPLSLAADPDRLHQVLANLVTNAVQHASGTPITLAAHNTDGRVRFTVSDHGPGIPDPERVFERFYTVDGARSGRADRGAGLGLPIARWIVELHGGDIAVEPNQPRGCRVLVHLPSSHGSPS